MNKKYKENEITEEKKGKSITTCIKKDVQLLEREIIMTGGTIQILYSTLGM